MINRIRNYFFAGVAVILPIVLTAWVLFHVFMFADNLLGKFINDEIKEFIGFYIPGISIVVTVVLVVGIGFLATRLLGRWFLFVFEHWFFKFPFVRQIYTPAKQIVEFLFSSKKPTFKQTVLVEYPRKGIWSIGFITAEVFAEAKEKTKEELLTIYVPGSPNPITAYVIFVPKKDVVFLDVSVEKAMKLIVSGGILQP